MTSTLRTLDFGPLTITWHDGVLEPRPWTAAQSRWAAEVAADLPEGPMLELCSGAGHIGLLAAHLSGRDLICVDLSPEACELTRSNAEAAGLAARVEVREGSMDAVLKPDERFGLVIADPPWVESASIDTYPEDPVLAIDGGADGLALARLCLTVSATHLDSGGFVLLQVGTAEQVESLVSEADAQGLEVVETREEERGVLALWRRA